MSQRLLKSCTAVSRLHLTKKSLIFDLLSNGKTGLYDSIYNPNLNYCFLKQGRRRKADVGGSAGGIGSEQHHFSFVLITSQEIQWHPSFDISGVVEERLDRTRTSML